MRITRRGFDYRGNYIEILDDEGGSDLGDFVHQAYNKKLFTALEKLARYEDVDDDPEIVRAFVLGKARKAHWINTANPENSDNIVCDKCGYDSIALFNYCPDCGSRMVENENSKRV